MKEITKSLFETDTEALVNAVNCVGVMGKGIALQFKRKFSDEYFKAYKNACQNRELVIGKVQVFELKNTLAEARVFASVPRFIINFPTKNHWRERSRIEYIESGLESLTEAVERYEIKSIAMPALGCGLGGLVLEDVKPLIERAFGRMPNVEVRLCLR